MGGSVCDRRRRSGERAQTCRGCRLAAVAVPTRLRTDDAGSPGCSGGLRPADHQGCAEDRRGAEQKTDHDAGGGGTTKRFIWAPAAIRLGVGVRRHQPCWSTQHAARRHTAALPCLGLRGGHDSMSHAQPRPALRAMAVLVAVPVVLAAARRRPSAPPPHRRRRSARRNRPVSRRMSAPSRSSRRPGAPAWWRRLGDAGRDVHRDKLAQLLMVGIRTGPTPAPWWHLPRRWHHGRQLTDLSMLSDGTVADIANIPLPR